MRLDERRPHNIRKCEPRLVPQLAETVEIAIALRVADFGTAVVHSCRWEQVERVHSGRAIDDRPQVGSMG